MERNKFYSFKLKGWHTPVDGVIELIGSEWILVKRITVDYTLDGYSLIQRKYIESNQCDDETSFTEKVLLAKGVMDIPNFYNISLEAQTDPFTWLKERNVVVQFNPKDDSICYVGRIGDMSKKFFQMISMDTRGGWDTVFYKYAYDSMRTIDIDCDYVKSLVIYNERISPVGSRVKKVFSNMKEIIEPNKFYLFKLKDRKTLEGGFVESIGSEWILVKNIAGDYALDGYRLIRRKYIEKHISDDDTSFTENVLLAKGVMNTPIPYNIPLDTQEAPLAWLKEHDLTVSFIFKNNSAFFVGKISKVTKRFIQFLFMDTRGGWDTVSYKYTYAKIVAIDIDSDYVNSLITYSNFESKKDSF